MNIAVRYSIIQFCCDKLSGSSETGGSKFLNCLLGPAMDTSYSPVLSRICPKCVVVFFFRRGLPHTADKIKTIISDKVNYRGTQS